MRRSPPLSPIPPECDLRVALYKSICAADEDVRDTIKKLLDVCELGQWADDLAQAPLRVASKDLNRLAACCLLGTEGRSEAFDKAARMAVRRGERGRKHPKRSDKA